VLPPSPPLSSASSASAASASAALLATGEGALLVDVCSGRGLGALLLSRLMPGARVVMIDANPDMHLAHVARRPNLEFRQLDLFSADAVATLAELREAPAASFGACVALGTHLCGSLSPRLLALASHLDAIDACVLCPCCIKGGLGQHVKTSARASSRPNYEVLLEVLGGFAVRECDGSAHVSIRQDEAMLSPRNGFVSVVKRRKE